MVVPTNRPTFDTSEYKKMPRNYSKMKYRHIKQIRMDDNPLSHWEELTGMFSVAHGEILRFILSAKIPLEKFIRYELASRGYDKDFKWVGFEKAEAIWLK